MDTFLSTVVAIMAILLMVGGFTLSALNKRVTSLEKYLHSLQEDLDDLKPCNEPDVVRGPPGGMW